MPYKYGRHDEWAPPELPKLPDGLLPFAWPLIFGSSLVGGILVSLVYLTRPRSVDDVHRRYFEPRAACEAFIAIVSGGLLWIGFWDFMDTYLVPEQWWAKLCMLLVGALGALGTRSLYSVQTLQAHRPGYRGDEGTSVVEQEDDVELGTILSPKRAMEAAGFDSPSAQPPTRRRRLCCLDPPAFSCSRCSRALLSTFFGLLMWVGLWDLIDTHLLPIAFNACSHEPSRGCAAVRLSLVGVGAMGLWLTRSLYGDHGSAGAVQFSRIQ